MKSCLDLASEFSRLACFIRSLLALGIHMPMQPGPEHPGIQQVSDHAAELDMKVAVENMVNMPAILGRRPEEVMGIIETVDRENVGFIFDVGHANTNGNVEDFLNIAPE